MGSRDTPLEPARSKGFPAERGSRRRAVVCRFTKGATGRGARPTPRCRHLPLLRDDRGSLARREPIGKAKAKAKAKARAKERASLRGTTPGKLPGRGSTEITANRTLQTTCAGSRCSLRRVIACSPCPKCPQQPDQQPGRQAFSALRLVDLRRRTPAVSMERAKCS